MKKYLNEFAVVLCIGLLFSCRPEQKTEATKPEVYTIRNQNGMEAKFCSNGARLMRLLVPDKNGNRVDVVAGFDNPEAYDSATEPYFGATIGRYGNRIAKGKFSLNGKEYQLTINNGVNTLHGGTTGFQYKQWTLKLKNDSTLVCQLQSPDGDNGFPGNMKVEVTYALNHKNELSMSYRATADQNTVVNLTNHAFFNLNGSGSILGHKLTINAEQYTPVDSTLIPTGEIVSVKGTPFDFTTSTPIGERINTKNEQLKFGKGYDHNFALSRNGMPAAVVIGDKTGIVMTIRTSEPGLQFYSGNFMQGKNELRSGPDHFRTAFCLETQHFPDAPNHPSFESTTLSKGKLYETSSVYAFGTTQ